MVESTTQLKILPKAFSTNHLLFFVTVHEWGLLHLVIQANYLFESAHGGEGFFTFFEGFESFFNKHTETTNVRCKQTGEWPNAFHGLMYRPGISDFLNHYLIIWLESPLNFIGFLPL